MKSKWQPGLILILVGLLAACAPLVPTSPPVSPLSPLRSPSPLPTPQPPANKIAAFRLNKPIFEGTDQVTGTGPEGVPIMIVDVTFMGEPLGQGVIGSNGVFAIKVPVLEKNHRIGIMLGNLTGTPWKMEDFYAPEYRGDEAVQMPMVGFVYDSAMVKEK